MELLKLEIVTPNGVIFDADAKQVNLPGSEGEFGVLAGHAALVSLLDTGVIVIEKEDGSEIAVAINSGLSTVDMNITIDATLMDGAGAGGDEASIFVADLYRMYLNYFRDLRFKSELVSMSAGDEGIKEVIFSVSGDKVYSKLKYESGVH